MLQMTTVMFHLSQAFSHSWLFTVFVTRLTRYVTPVEKELLTLPEHMSSSRFSVVRITRSLALDVWFVDRCLSLFSFSFGHCVVCPFLIYGFWFLQTRLTLERVLSTVIFRKEVICWHKATQTKLRCSYVNIIATKHSTVVITIWWTITKYLYVKWQWIFYYLRRFLLLSSITAKTLTVLTASMSNTAGVL